MGLNTGLGNLQSRLDDRQKKIESSRNRLRLGDGDRAAIRFISSAEEFYVPNVHSVEDVVSKGTKFWRRIVCTDADDCTLCLKGVQKAERIYVWVWVRYILHKKMVEGRDWDQVKSKAGDVYYKEEVNAPKVLETGIGKGRNIAMKFINANAEYGTLNDREYTWSRSGGGMDTLYDLMPGKEGKFDHQDEDAVKGLDSLETVVKAGNDDLPSTNKPAVSSQATEDAVSSSHDDGPDSGELF